MTDEAILTAHGFTQTQAADAMCKSPVRRSEAEKALVAALVQAAKESAQ
jgi:hypothetical protein